MGKKYKTKKEGNMLRIIALKSFFGVKKGDIGGLIEKEENLSQEDICWVYPNAVVFGNACVSGNARVCGWSNVFGEAKVSGNAIVSDSDRIYGNAVIDGNARVFNNAEVSGDIKLWSTENSYVGTSIKNNEDYVILVKTKKEFCIFSSAVDILTNTTATLDYLNNIQTIRQLYGEEV